MFDTKLLFYLKNETTPKMNINSVSFFQNEEVKQVGNDCELILAAWNVKTPENLGHIIRLGHNAGAKKVLFINKNNNYRESKIRKVAGFSFDQMDWQIISADEFFTLLNGTFQLLILETCEGSTNIFETQLPDRAIILAGNESHGLPPEVIAKRQLKIHIPMPGDCKSMNVSHALSVAAFEWYRQH